MKLIHVNDLGVVDISELEGSWKFHSVVFSSFSSGILMKYIYRFLSKVNILLYLLNIQSLVNKMNVLVNTNLKLEILVSVCTFKALVSNLFLYFGYFVLVIIVIIKTVIVIINDNKMITNYN